MHMFMPTEAECLERTEGLTEAPPIKKWEKEGLLPKEPRGPVPIDHRSHRCDGYYLGLMSHGGSKYFTLGLNWFGLGTGGVLLAVLLEMGYSSGWTYINPFITEGKVFNEIFGAYFFWTMTLACLALGIWAQIHAGSAAFSQVIFSREHGTVSFPKTEQRPYLMTVPFETVEMGAYSGSTGSGGRTWQAQIYCTLHPPGQKPRKEMVFLSGMMREDFQRQWNMICRFMDSTIPIPPCLHGVIALEQGSGHDLWGQPYREGRVFDPPLHQRDMPPEVEAILEQMELALWDEGYTETEIAARIQAMKDSWDENKEQRQIHRDEVDRMVYEAYGDEVV